MTHNTGETGLRRKRRGDPMRDYYGLPKPLRHWVAQATLPWSAASVRRIWAKSRARGMSEAEVLEALSAAEARTLARGKVTRTPALH